MSRFFQRVIEHGVCVLEIMQPVGSLADQELLAELEGILQQLRAGQERAVCIDFREIPYFGSSLLEALRIIWNELEPRSGRMALCRLSPIGCEIIQLTKFDHLWPLFNTRAEAIERLIHS